MPTPYSFSRKLAVLLLALAFGFSQVPREVLHQEVVHGADETAESCHPHGHAHARTAPDAPQFNPFCCDYDDIYLAAFFAGGSSPVFAKPVAPPAEWQAAQIPPVRRVLVRATARGPPVLS